MVEWKYDSEKELTERMIALCEKHGNEVPIGDYWDLLLEYDSDIQLQSDKKFWMKLNPDATHYYPVNTCGGC